MYLKDVEIFCEVAARRSFSKAAEAQSMSQSSASHAVIALERRLGRQLVDRSKRPLELTRAGEIYYEGCRDLLQTLRAVEDRVRGVDDRPRGKFTVAAIFSVGLMQMESLVRRFEEQNPEVEVRLEYRHPDEVYRAVRNGEAEIGLVSFPREGGEFESLPWQEQEMVFVVPPGHRLAAAGRVPPSEFEGEEFVAFDASLPVRRQIDRWLRAAGVTIDVVQTFDNVEHVKRAVEVGAGVALLPRPTLSRELDLGSLAAVAPAGVAWLRPLGIVHRRHKALSTAARRFAESLRADANATAAAGVSADAPLATPG